MGKTVIGKIQPFLMRLSKLDEKYMTRVKRVVDAGRLNIERVAKRRAPYDEGLLRAGIESSLVVEANRVIGIVKAGKKYSIYNEFGTGLYVDPALGMAPHLIRPKNKKFLRFETKTYKGKTPSGRHGGFDRGVVFTKATKGMRPHPFMRPAYAEELPKIIRALHKIKLSGGK